MGKYLLLCRIKYEDGVIEPVYKWFSGADKMENYIRNVGKICRANVSYRITCNNGNQRTLINP